MKIKRFTLLTLPVLAIAIGAIVLSGSSESRYFPRNSEKHLTQSADGFLNYMQMVKANRATGDVNPNDVFAAVKQADKMPKSKASLNVNWSFIGPDNIGGRTRALIIDRDDSDHLVAGGVAGGVFESFNGAKSWRPYDTDFKVNNISCITQSTNGSFYVGTGGHFENSTELNGPERTERGYFFVGSGIHKLTGDGNFELIIGPSTRNSISVDYATIGEIAASPDDPNKLYVAMNNGFRILEIDPNNGSVAESDPIGLNQKCADVAVSDDGKVVVSYLGQGGQSGRVYVSQGNDNFSLSNPTTNMGRIEIAIAPSNSSIMYASVTDRSSTCLRGIFRSRDSGQNWESIAPPGTSTFDMFANFGVNCQGKWDNVIAVYPDNPGKILVGGVKLYQWNQSSEDPAPANGSWKQIDVLTDFSVAGERIPNYLHADKHVIVFDPDDSDVAYFATDGGIAKSTNIDDEIPYYEVSNYNYGVTQYYAIGVNNMDIVIGGTQDNGSHIINLRNSSNKAGYDVLGGDGFDCELSSIDTSIGFATVYNNSISRIQGIGTDPGNSNFSTSNVTAINPFLSGACNSGNGCSIDFYSTTTFWESFNHEASHDSATVQVERKSLPPIHLSTSIPFESNNNQMIIQEATVDSSWPDVDKYWNITSIDTLPQTGVQPDDTIPTESGRFDTLLLNGANNQIVVNYDTFMVDTLNQIVQINRRTDTGAVISVNYTLGTEYDYTNLLIGGNYDVRFKVDTFTTGSLNGTSYLMVEDMSIHFRYFSLDAIRTGIYPFDTISAGIGVYDTLELASLPMVHNFDTISIDAQTNSVIINRRGDTSSSALTINYVLGSEDSYESILLGSTDLIKFVVDTFKFGSKIGQLYIAVENKDIIFRYSFKVQDKVQSIYASANWPGLNLSGLDYTKRNIFITRDMLKGNPDIEWFQVAGSNSTPDGIVGSVLDMTFSADGDHLFVGTSVGRVYRISGINNFDISNKVRATSNQNFDSLINSGGPLDGKCYEIGRFLGQSVTAIDVDPNNPDNVLVALGNYGNSGFVARTTAATTATDNTTFEYIQGVGNTSLPTAPAYAVLMFKSDHNKVLVGNELGVFGTDNAFANDPSTVEWTEENSGMGRVPVFDIKQMRHDYTVARNSGKIYIGTHGRGIYTYDLAVGIDNKETVNSSKSFQNSMRIYPNPVQDITSIEFNVENTNSAVLVEIYNIRGQKVKVEQLNQLVHGKNLKRLNLSELDRGTYIIRAIHQNQMFSSKFIKQ